MTAKFAFRPPAFAGEKTPKSGTPIERSIYFWWFEFLRRNTDYRATCDAGGVGPCSDLYKDFGDVHSTDFKDWWDANGVRLFAVPEAASIRIVTDTRQHNFEQTRKHLVLSIPLDLPMAHLVRRFKYILSLHHQGKRGHRHPLISEARYQSGGKIDTKFLKSALQVWDIRNANPAKALWEIANDLKLCPTRHLFKPNDYARKRGDPILVTKKNVLAATASRHLRKAKEMIEATSSGQFPHKKPHSSVKSEIGSV